MINTINGDSNVPFYKELGNSGSFKATDVPVVAFSVGEEELRGLDHQAAGGQARLRGNYFMSIKNPANTAFKENVLRLAQEGATSPRSKKTSA